MKGPPSSGYQAPNFISHERAFAAAVNSSKSGSINNHHSGGDNPGTRFIDKTYDQWNKFENFLKFASKKEVRDRLKEFDAPDLNNYIDPDTIDKINKTHKAPIYKPGQGAKQQNKDKGKQSPREVMNENKQRI